MTVSRPVGGVLSTGPLRGSGWVTIHLCGQPGRIHGRTTLSLFGLAPDGVCQADRVTPAAGALLPHRFTLTCARRSEEFRAIGGLFSVALSCGSPRLAASQHPVLWSPDLPQHGRPGGVRPRSPGQLTVGYQSGGRFPLRHPALRTSNARDMDTLLDTPVQPCLAPSSVTPAASLSVTRSETLTAMDVEALEGVDTSGQWYLRSACRGLEASIFYPDPDVTEDVARALAVCAACEVREVCLAHALGRREPTGIWGGTTERERRRVLRRRRSA